MLLASGRDLEAAAIQRRFELQLCAAARRGPRALEPLLLASSQHAGVPTGLVSAGCRAVGGSAEQALPGMVVIHCSQLAIGLVDSLLNDDRAVHLSSFGSRERADLALAAQSAALGALGELGSLVEPLTLRLAQMGMETALGRSKSVDAAATEDALWEVLRLRTQPAFTAALYLGARLGGADPPLAHSLSEIGADLGLLCHVNDDIARALDRERQTAWRRPGANLVLRFAAEVAHPGRERFRQLLPAAVEDAAARREATELVAASGAFSYCLYQVVQLADRARRQIASRAPIPEPLQEFVESHLEGVHHLLAAAHAEEGGASRPSSPATPPASRLVDGRH